MLCPNCGYDNSPNNRFCVRCGVDISVPRRQTRRLRAGSSGPAPRREPRPAPPPRGPLAAAPRARGERRSPAPIGTAPAATAPAYAPPGPYGNSRRAAGPFTAPRRLPPSAGPVNAVPAVPAIRIPGAFDERAGHRLTRPQHRGLGAVRRGIRGRRYPGFRRPQPDPAVAGSSGRRRAGPGRHHPRLRGDRACFVLFVEVSSANSTSSKRRPGTG